MITQEQLKETFERMLALRRYLFERMLALRRYL